MPRELKRKSKTRVRAKAPDDPELIFNWRLREHAKVSEFSFAEIAKRAGIPERRFRRLLSGETRLLAGDAWDVAAVLGMTTDRLLGSPDAQQGRAA